MTMIHYLAALSFLLTTTAFSQPVKSLLVPNVYDTLYSVAISSDGQQIIAGSSPVVSIWDSRNGKLIGELREENVVTSVAISPDKKRAFVGNVGFQGHIWNLESKSVLFTLDTYTAEHLREDPNYYKHVYTGGVRSSEFSRDGKRLMTGDTDGAVQLWDVETGKELKRYERIGAVYSLDVSPDGKLFAVNSSAGNRIVQLDTGKVLHNFTYYPFVVSDDWSTILISSDDELQLVSLLNNQVIARIPYSETGPISKSFALSPDKAIALIGGRDAFDNNFKGRRAFDLPKRSLLHKYKFEAESKDSPYATDAFLLFFPDGNRYLTVNGNSINIWNISDLKSAVSNQEYK